MKNLDITSRDGRAIVNHAIQELGDQFAIAEYLLKRSLRQKDLEPGSPSNNDVFACLACQSDASLNCCCSMEKISTLKAK